MYVPEKFAYGRVSDRCPKGFALRLKVTHCSQWERQWLWEHLGVKEILHVETG